MKTKKVIVGAVAASMLSLSVCSIAPVSIAAGETVQISVGKESAKAGEQFEVEVTLADIPSTGLQGVEFALKYDSSLISISSISAGPITATGAQDQDSSSAFIPVFDTYLAPGYASVVWSTALEDSTYWLKKDGVFCTIKGSVASGVADGTTAKIEVVPNDRDTTETSGTKNDKILCGYEGADGKPVQYDVAITNGSVTVGSGVVAATLKGDANCDGEVNLADAVFIMQTIAGPNKYKLSPQGEANADVVGNDGVTNKDALEIQKYTLGLVTSL